MKLGSPVKNRRVNRQYWNPFKDRKWPAYCVVIPAKSVDSIVEGVDFYNELIYNMNDRCSSMVIPSKI